MAWTVGEQKPRKNTLISNKEILEKKGFLDEREAKLLFYQFLRNNVTFATHLLCDTELLPFQHIMIKSMLESDYFLGVISRGGSKCRSYNDLVSTDNGVKMMIDVQVGEKILAKRGYCLVEDKVVNEAQKTYKITSRRGFESEGLDHHRVLVLNKDLTQSWKFSQDLSVGDCLIMRKNAEFPEQSDIFDDFILRSYGTTKQGLDLKKASVSDWYLFFGLLIGDGHFGDNTVGITSQDEEIGNFLKSFAEKIGFHLQICPKANNVFDYRISSLLLKQFLIHCGFTPRMKALNKTIPFKLLKASKENICLLLNGLFSTDGYISQREKRRNSNCIRIGYTSCSYQLIKQVRFLLLNLGIVSKTGVCFKGGLSKFSDGKSYVCNKAWSIYIASYDNVKLFAENIGFCIKRKQDKLKVIESAKFTNGEFSEYIPYIGEFLEKKYNQKSFYVGPGPKLNFRKNTSKALAAKLANEVDEETSNKIKELLDPNLFFDFVKSVEESSCVTVDIQVKDEHCYVSDGFINHNSWSTGIYAFLDAVFNQGIQIGIISSGFRQSKLLFRKIEDLAAKPGAYLMRQAITKISHGSDSWTLELGRSKIIALPLGDGEKLRGYRFNRIIIDEFLLMPERIVTEVVMPFLAVNSNPVERKNLYDLQTKLIERGEMTEDDRYEWPANKLIALSSASYKFENLYKYYQQLEKLILNPKVDEKTRRCIIQLSCDSLPQQLYDGNQIQQARATMSDAQFSREYGAQFTNESDGFFSVQKMLACTVPDGEQPCVEAYGNPNDEYIIGLDSSWAESETSDSFAIQVVKLLPEKKSSVLVHSYEIPGMALKDHISYFHYLLTNFNVVSVCMDMNGGLTFMSACNESECFKNSGIHLKPIETKFDKAEEYNANLISGRNEYNKTTHRYVIQRIPTSQWIRTANELMQANLDNKKIYFASMAMDEEFRRQSKKNIGISNLKYKRKSAEEESIENVDWDTSEGSVSDTKNKALMIDFLEHLHDTIQLTKTQLAMIVPTTTIQGTQSFDLPKNVKGSGRDRARKDSYSAILLANWAVKIYFDMLAVTVEETDSTFTPMMI
jgi:intein/homing endonuclease